MSNLSPYMYVHALVIVIMDSVADHIILFRITPEQKNLEQSSRIFGYALHNRSAELINSRRSQHNFDIDSNISKNSHHQHKI